MCRAVATSRRALAPGDGAHCPSALPPNLNAKRLHATALAMQAEMVATNAQSLVAQLAEKLHQSGATAEHVRTSGGGQLASGSATARLAEGLSNDLSPACKQAREA